MELKRSLTKRLRSRRSAVPEKLDLPPRMTPVPNGSDSYPAPATPNSPFNNFSPFLTPSTEEFAAIPFDGTACASKLPENVSPTRSITSSMHSPRSSRSGSITNLQFAPATWTTPTLAPIMTQTSSTSSGVLISPGSGRQNSEHLFEVALEDDKHLESAYHQEVYEADKMAQQILEKVHDGRKHRWSL